MNVVFFGYRPWAIKIGRNLENAHWPYWKVVDVVTEENPNLEQYLLTHDIKEDTVFLFYGWSWKIPEYLYAQHLCLILHTSPLPKYRGGSPLQHQIMAGEKESAITICKVEEKIDTGDIYAQKAFSLDGTLSNIFYQIAEIGTTETNKLLEDIALGKAKPVKQDESKATTYKRRKPEESELTIEDLKTMTATQIYNFIRALQDPYPNAFIRDRSGKKVYLTGAKIDETR